jgi:hypothetical protein
MPGPELELCQCGGADPACPECGGSGVTRPELSRVRGCPWMVNVHVPEGTPYYEGYLGVTCKYCGRRVKRRKIWKHIRQEHGDAELSAFVPELPKP